jgi:hypothetical protein
MARRNAAPTDLHMLLLWWIDSHPGDSPDDLAGVFGIDVDEIAKLCADLAAAAFIEPTTLH